MPFVQNLLIHSSTPLPHPHIQVTSITTSLTHTPYTPVHPHNPALTLPTKWFHWKCFFFFFFFFVVVFFSSKNLNRQWVTLVFKVLVNISIIVTLFILNVWNICLFKYFELFFFNKYIENKNVIYDRKMGCSGLSEFWKMLSNSSQF